MFIFYSIESEKLLRHISFRIFYFFWKNGNNGKVFVCLFTKHLIWLHTPRKGSFVKINFGLKQISNSVDKFQFKVERKKKPESSQLSLFYSSSLFRHQKTNRFSFWHPNYPALSHRTTLDHSMNICKICKVILQIDSLCRLNCYTKLNRCLIGTWIVRTTTTTTTTTTIRLYKSNISLLHIYPYLFCVSSCRSN